MGPQACHSTLAKKDGGEALVQPLLKSYVSPQISVVSPKRKRSKAKWPLSGQPTGMP